MSKKKQSKKKKTNKNIIKKASLPSTGVVGFILKILAALFPFIPNYVINKKLKSKVVESNSTYNINWQKISLDIIESNFQETLKRKDKLEDKAKSIIVTITISITLIINSSKIIADISNKYNNKIIHLISAIFLILSIIYMIIAGILSIQTLMDENVIYQPNLAQYTLEANELKNVYDELSAKNNNQNLVRNNNIYTSFECIRNSLIILVLLVSLLVLPFSPSTSANSSKFQTNITLGHSITNNQNP